MSSALARPTQSQQSTGPSPSSNHPTHSHSHNNQHHQKHSQGYPSSSTSASSTSATVTGVATSSSSAPIQVPVAPLVEPPNLFSAVAPQIYRSATPTTSSHPFLRSLQLRTILSLTAELPSPTLQKFCNKNGIKFLHFGGKRWCSSSIDIDGDISGLPPKQQQQQQKETQTLQHNHHQRQSEGGSFEKESSQSLDPLPDLSISFLQAHKPTQSSFSSNSLTEELIKDSLQVLLNSQYHPILVTDTSGIHEIGVLLGCLRKLQRWNFATILLEYRNFAGNRARATNERFVEMFDTDLVTFPEKDLLPAWFREQIEADEAELDRLESLDYEP